MLGGLLDAPKRPFVVCSAASRSATSSGSSTRCSNGATRSSSAARWRSRSSSREGGTVGDSLVEPDQVAHCQRVADHRAHRRSRPTRRGHRDDADATTRHVSADGIPDGFNGFDIGPETRGHLCRCDRGAATVLWNGPMGVFEMAPFGRDATVAEAVAECRGFTVVGGGDSALGGAPLRLADAIDHVSHRRGASLESFECGDLPGPAALHSQRCLTHGPTRKPLMAGNWKMHHNHLEAIQSCRSSRSASTRERLRPGRRRRVPRRSPCLRSCRP